MPSFQFSSVILKDFLLKTNISICVSNKNFITLSQSILVICSKYVYNFLNIYLRQAKIIITKKSQKKYILILVTVNSTLLANFSIFVGGVTFPENKPPPNITTTTVPTPFYDCLRTREYPLNCRGSA